jgi:hypothetical protein
MKRRERLEVANGPAGRAPRPDGGEGAFRPPQPPPAAAPQPILRSNTSSRRPATDFAIEYIQPPPRNRFCDRIHL